MDSSMKRKCVDIIASLISRDHFCCDPIRRLSINFIAIWPSGHVLFYGDMCLFVILLMDERNHLGLPLVTQSNVELHFEKEWPYVKTFIPCFILQYVCGNVIAFCKLFFLTSWKNKLTNYVSKLLITLINFTG